MHFELETAKVKELCRCRGTSGMAQLLSPGEEGFVPAPLEQFHFEIADEAMSEDAHTSPQTGFRHTKAKAFDR